MTNRQVMESLNAADYAIVDVRPTGFFTGQKVEEGLGG